MEELFQSLQYLIIDDFEQMRLSFKGMLTSMGATEIDTCANGEDGLKTLAKKDYDVVICDYNLGEGKDGQQVLEEARHLGYVGYACSFFLITAESNMPLVLGALEQQPDEYMVKPINSDVLEHRLSASLKQKQEVNAIDKALKEGNKSQAIQCCETLKNSNIKRSLYLSKLEAELCIDLKRYDQAEAVYRELLKIRSFPWARFGLGKIACLKGERAEATTIFQALIKENQHYLEAYDWLARVLEEEGKLCEAQEKLQKAVKFSPKLVRRQRNLGRLAQANGDTEIATRAFQSAIRWGEHSCFATASEYRQLASLYQHNGGAVKVKRLLSDGQKRFNRDPSDLMQILALQAQVDHRCNNKEAANKNITRINRLISDYKGAIAADDLLATADDLIQLSYTEEAETLLEVLICNHHDDETWSDRVVCLLRKHNLEKNAHDLMQRSQGVLKKIHHKCLGLIKDGGLEQAVELLNGTVDQYPSNRTLVLMAASAMIDYMKEHGSDQGFLFRCRYSLNRLLVKNSEDCAADKYLKALNQIAT
jgi:DNA-binding response OmpR family regulator/Tfp pilus assembly protein PilF